jgi:hypothetical protein
MKVFIIKRGFIAGSGHSVTVVKAINDTEALNKYKEHLHMDCLPIGIGVQEITEDVCEVYHYDNPLYKG